MKNRVTFLIGMLIVGIFLVSCNKDDDDSGTKNYLKIGDTEYELFAGLLENFGTDSWYNGYLGKLILYSDGLSLHVDEEDHYEFLGIGDAIYFTMYSTSGNVLDNNVYVFASSEPCPIGTFSEGGYTINFDTGNWDAEDSDDIVSGSVTISLSETEYSITFDCAGKNDKKITGFYKGTLRYFDSSH
jgi:hypothetical protein